MACQICGKPSGFYPLCNDCFKLRDTGKIEKCEECGIWHRINEPCECDIEDSDDYEENEYNNQCLLCENDAGNYLFCSKCYHKYKNRSIDIRITNCSEITILDEYGNLTITCDDGRKVRSRAEALISNFLYNNKIRSVYEKTVYYKENGEDKTLHPDFYLPDYDVYIEYNEIKTKNYLESKEYTKAIYERLGMKVITMDDQDLKNIPDCLKPKLGIN